MLPFLLACLVLSGCANQSVKAVDETKVNSDFQAILTAMNSGDSAAASRAMAAYDAAYGTTMSKDFASNFDSSARLSSGTSSYPELTDMPFTVDGAVYLSGGGDSVVSKVIDWVSPKNFPGGYFHGAALDLDKFDPNNLSAASLETAVTKGAGWQSASDWRKEVNACVLVPNFAVDKAKLDAAQKDVAYYCDLPSDKEEYGFFKNYVNIFNVVTKEDTYTWYCTKVAWKVWKDYGIDIDSNSSQVDFTKSGLYSLVKAYYNTLYFYSSSKANAAMTSYISDAKQKIVFAEEIMCSPYLTKVYEKIRKN
jgi:hypothetical protein